MWDYYSLRKQQQAACKMHSEEKDGRLCGEGFDFFSGFSQREISSPVQPNPSSLKTLSLCIVSFCTSIKHSRKMANKDIAKLEAEFPEMSQSVIADVFKTYGKDTKKATEALRSIKNQSEVEKEKKIRELSELFPTVPKNEIESTLESCNGDIDAALVPLFNKAEEIRNVRCSDNVEVNFSRKMQEKNNRKQRKKESKMLN